MDRSEILGGPTGRATSLLSIPAWVPVISSVPDATGGRDFGNLSNIQNNMEKDFRQSGMETS
jgi:hypothetical protein